MSLETIPSRPARRRPRNIYIAFVRAQPLATAGLIILAMLVLAALAADVISPYDPLQISFGEVLAPPSASHLMGTDPFGRDIFSRVIHGARTALAIGLISSFVGCSIGALIGVVSAYFGGIVDTVAQRLVDVLLAFPIIILALVTVSALGHNYVGNLDISLLIAVAIPAVPNVARVVRSVALSIRSMPYVDAARASGFSHARIILRHILPNVAAPYLVMLTAYMGQAILLEATLSYLGLGVGEPTASWGVMLSGVATDSFIQAPWQVVFPGLAISLAVFAFNILGDGVRDWLDPKFQI